MPGWNACEKRIENLQKIEKATATLQGISLQSTQSKTAALVGCQYTKHKFTYIALKEVMSIKYSLIFHFYLEFLHSATPMNYRSYNEPGSYTAIDLRFILQDWFWECLQLQCSQYLFKDHLNLLYAVKKFFLRDTVQIRIE